MDEYLVISRGHDAPHFDLLSEAQLKDTLNGEWNDYNFITEIPDIESFPSESLFIFKGEIAFPYSLYWMLSAVEEAR